MSVESFVKDACAASSFKPLPEDLQLFKAMSLKITINGETLVFWIGETKHLLDISNCGDTISILEKLIPIYDSASISPSVSEQDKRRLGQIKRIARDTVKYGLATEDLNRKNGVNWKRIDGGRAEFELLNTKDRIVYKVVNMKTKRMVKMELISKNKHKVESTKSRVPLQSVADKVSIYREAGLGLRARYR